jgi:flagellar motility protein MotE (MotC chaperone)
LKKEANEIAAEITLLPMQEVLGILESIEESETSVILIIRRVPDLPLS